MNSKSILFKFLIVFVLIFNWALPSMGESWIFGISTSNTPQSGSGLLVEKGPRGTYYTGGIDLIRQRVEELVEKLTNQHPDLKADILALRNNSPISIYETNNINCRSVQDCSADVKFIGSLSPIKIKDQTLFITTRHSLNGFTQKNKKLIFEPQIEFNEFKIIEFKLIDESYYSDLILIAPNTYLDSLDSCRNRDTNSSKLEDRCVYAIKTKILTQFTNPEANSYWLSAQPILDQSILENQNSVEWKFAAGIINPTKYRQSQNSPYLSHFFSLVNNTSNLAQPGVSGNLIRKINFNAESRQPSIGKFLGMIVCKSKPSTIYAGFTFALNIQSFFQDTNLEGYFTTINHLSQESKREYNIFTQLECDPVDGRGGVGGY